MSGFIEFTVPPQDDGLAVREILKRRMGISSSLLSRLKTLENGIMLDGRRVTVRACARAGQTVRAAADTGRGRAAVPVAGALDIVFEDEHLIVLNKPAGLVVHPSRGHYEDTLANRLAHYLGTGAATRIINRIDKVTSGLLCAAKSAYSAQALARQMAAGGIKREYLAVADGCGLPESGVIDAPIARAEGRGIARCVRADGQRAVTRYTKVREQNGRTLLRVRLETGRTHQIRVHLAHIGAPVAGDFMYGTELPRLPGHALHSARLSLRALSGRALEFECAPPSYFWELLESPPKCHASSKSTTMP